MLSLQRGLALSLLPSPCTSVLSSVCCTLSHLFPLACISLRPAPLLWPDTQLGAGPSLCSVYTIAPPSSLHSLCCQFSKQLKPPGVTSSTPGHRSSCLGPSPNCKSLPEEDTLSHCILNFSEEQRQRAFCCTLKAVFPCEQELKCLSSLPYSWKCSGEPPWVQGGGPGSLRSASPRIAQTWSFY